MSSMFQHFRLSLRWQMVLLLSVLVLFVAALSLKITWSFLERDKIDMARDLQVLQNSEASRLYQESFERLRVKTRENALKLLDPMRGQVDLAAPDWFWLRVNDKAWAAPNVEVPAALSDTAPVTEAYLIRSNPKTLRLVDVLHVKVQGQDRLFPIEAEFSLTLLQNDRLQTLPGSSRLKLVSREKSGALSCWLCPGVVTDSWLQKIQKDLFSNNTVPQGTISKVVNPTQADAELVSATALSIPLKDTQLLLLSSVKRQDLLAKFQEFIAEQVYWAGVLLGLGLFLALLFSGWIIRPLQTLVRAASIMESGDFSVRVFKRLNDEVGDLSDAFNHMGQSLQEREEALKEANMALIQNEKMAALGMISAGLAHEVKNPLAGIMGKVDLSLMELKRMGVDLSSAVPRNLEIISKEAKRCRGIIDNLMRFSRKETIEMEATDLEHVVLDAVQLMEHPLKLAHIHIEKEFDANLHLVKASANQIEQILLNMLQNAGHAMPEGGKVFIGTQYVASSAQLPMGRHVVMGDAAYQGPMCRLSVRDTGAGMTEEVQKKIFEPFFTTKPRGQGTGLGLSVTFKILQEHQARLSLNSAPGQGTAFFIDFPAGDLRSQEDINKVNVLKNEKADLETLNKKTPTPSVAPKTKRPPPPPPRREESPTAVAEMSLGIDESISSDLLEAIPESEENAVMSTAEAAVPEKSPAKVSFGWGNEEDPSDDNMKNAFSTHKKDKKDGQAA